MKLPVFSLKKKITQRNVPSLLESLKDDGQLLQYCHFICYISIDVPDGEDGKKKKIGVALYCSDP